MSDGTRTPTITAPVEFAVGPDQVSFFVLQGEGLSDKMTVRVTDPDGKYAWSASVAKVYGDRAIVQVSAAGKDRPDAPGTGQITLTVANPKIKLANVPVVYVDAPAQAGAEAAPQPRAAALAGAGFLASTGHIFINVRPGKPSWVVLKGGNYTANTDVTKIEAFDKNNQPAPFKLAPSKAQNHGLPNRLAFMVICTGHSEKKRPLTDPESGTITVTVSNGETPSVPVEYVDEP